jgi:hypothetical protein
MAYDKYLENHRGNTCHIDRNIDNIKDSLRKADIRLERRQRAVERSGKDMHTELYRKTIGLTRNRKNTLDGCIVDGYLLPRKREPIEWKMMQLMKYIGIDDTSEFIRGDLLGDNRCRLAFERRLEFVDLFFF